MTDLVDRIYEAAIVPELWPDVLGAIATEGQCDSGAMLVVHQRLPPLFAATPNISDMLGAFAASPAWYDNARIRCLYRLDHAGFVDADEAMTERERREDMARPYLLQLGMGSQLGTGIRLPGGEMVSISFDRATGAEAFDPATIGWFDALRPHLARASLMAAQLKQQQARVSVDALAALGIPAAVLATSGAVIAANRLFDAMDDVLVAAAFGRLALRDRNADRLLQAALPRPGQLGSNPAIRSIPLPAAAGDRSYVIHVMPLERAATDILDRGAALVVVSGYALDGNVPADAVLRGLFDLSPAEAGIAAGLAAGLTVAQIAAARGIGLTTARTHLAQIFRKTGTAQQGQLVALLKGAVGPVD